MLYEELVHIPKQKLICKRNVTFVTDRTAVEVLSYICYFVLVANINLQNRSSAAIKENSRHFLVLVEHLWAKLGG